MKQAIVFFEMHAFLVYPGNTSINNKSMHINTLYTNFLNDDGDNMALSQHMQPFFLKSDKAQKYIPFGKSGLHNGIFFYTLNFEHKSMTVMLFFFYIRLSFR